MTEKNEVVNGDIHVCMFALARDREEVPFK